MVGFFYFIFMVIWVAIVAAICLALFFAVSIFGLVSGFFVTAYQAKAVLQEAHRTEK